MIIQKHEVCPTDKKKRWTGKGVENGKSFCKLDKKNVMTRWRGDERGVIVTCRNFTCHIQIISRKEKMNYFLQVRFLMTKK